MILRKLLAVAAFATAATTACAEPVVYTCMLNNRPSRSFMSEKLAILYDPASGRARAIDGLIRQTYSRNIPVRVVTDDPARITFRWAVRNPKGRSQGVTSRILGVRETVTLLKDSLSVQVRQIPVGFDNSFTASGRCTERPYIAKPK